MTVHLQTLTLSSTAQHTWLLLLVSSEHVLLTYKSVMIFELMSRLSRPRLTYFRQYSMNKNEGSFS